MSLTPDTINTIRRNAGKIPPEQIARDCGVSLGLVERIAREQGFDLRIRATPGNPDIFPRAPIERQRRNLPLDERRIVTITVSLSEASAATLRAKAHERVVRPSAMFRQILEGAIVLGKIDELARASKSYRPGDAAGSGEG